MDSLRDQEHVRLCGDCQWLFDKYDESGNYCLCAWMPFGRTDDTCRYRNKTADECAIIRAGGGDRDKQAELL